VEFGNAAISVVRQCQLLGLARSTLYYRGRGVSQEDLQLMRLLDEQFTKTPFYGSRRMVVLLGWQGWVVNRKHVVRLMRVMGLEAIYPKPRLSQASKDHKHYPYLLSGKTITAADQVWSADISVPQQAA